MVLLDEKNKIKKKDTKVWWGQVRFADSISEPNLRVSSPIFVNAGHKAEASAKILTIFQLENEGTVIHGMYDSVMPRDVGPYPVFVKDILRG